jgi:radical SAM protein with 4Fe4S-binding SPASM domain
MVGTERRGRRHQLRLCLRLRRLCLRLRWRRALIAVLGRRHDETPSVPPPGLHAYPRRDSSGEAKLHLRVEPDGPGLLLVNADRALHLNPTATLMTWLVLEGHTDDEALALLRRRFRAPADTLRADYQEVRRQIDELSHADGACPIHGLDLDVLPPFSSTPSAPYRMDLALTYRCNNDCAHCYNARPRDYPEIDTPDWEQIIDRLWEAGVPHLCFTGGEATLRPDLPQLVTYAQAKGQITGLLTNGRRLSDPAYVQTLIDAGLDHVQITLESHDPGVHDRMVACRGAWRQTVDGIRNALATGLYVMTNTTLLDENAPELGQTLDFLAKVGVPTVGLNALICAGRGRVVGTGLPEADLVPLLDLARERTAAHRQRLVWYTPTQYCNFDPVQMDLGVKGCTAARYNMCVEPDGGVIPCQSYYQQVGSMLRDPWDRIWDSELSVWLRDRRYVPERCEACALLGECGGGCPLSLTVISPAARAAGQEG